MGAIHACSACSACRCSCCEADHRLSNLEPEVYSRPADDVKFGIASEDTDDDADDLLEETEKPPEQANSSAKRKALSAEAFGECNPWGAFEPPQHAKTEEQAQRLAAMLKRSFVFLAAQDDAMRVLLLAMEEVRFAKGAVIVRADEAVDCLYVIEEGSVECTRTTAGSGATKVVAMRGPGCIIGETAVLHSWPHEATAIAHEPCVCWRLDRATYTNVVRGAAKLHRAQCEAFLKSTKLLSGVAASELSEFSDVLHPATFEKGASLAAWYQQNKLLAFVEAGTLRTECSPGVVATREFGVGDYFGSVVPLLTTELPSYTDIVVTSELARLLCVEAEALSRMLSDATCNALAEQHWRLEQEAMSGGATDES